MKLAALAVAATLAAPPLAIATEFTRVLLPMSIADVPGAYGSIWTSSTTYTNPSATDIEVRYLAPTGRTVLLAHSHGFLPVSNSGSGALPGQFVYVESQGIEVIRFQTRVAVQGLAGSTGAIVPGVPTPQFTDGVLELLDVPVTDRSRTMLRVYDADGLGSVNVHVRTLGMYGAVLDDRVITLTVPPYLSFDPAMPRIPAYAQFSVVATPEEQSNSVFFEITPITPGSRIWAFATTTDNSTQAVTAVIPIP